MAGEGRGGKGGGRLEGGRWETLKPLRSPFFNLGNLMTFNLR